MATEFKTLKFNDTFFGQREKVDALKKLAAEGWDVVSETVTQGHIKGADACCLATICLPCGFCAGRTDGKITVTLKKESGGTPKEATTSQEKEQNETRRSVAKTYEPVLGVETNALITRANIFLEDSNFDEADRYFEQALNQDPKNPEVYLGKLMALRKVHNINELLENSTPLADDAFFQKALRFADGEEKDRLEGYLTGQRYTFALENRKKAKLLEDFERLASLFDGFGDYKDAKALAEEARENAEKVKPFEELVKRGKKYLEGDGVEKNRQEAIKCYQAAADQGYVKAKTALGDMYHADKNYIEALTWYRAAADQGYTKAQVALAWMYIDGDVKYDSKEGLKLLHTASEQGDGEASLSLGNIYSNKFRRIMGVPKAPQEAFKWYRIGAEQGDKNAQILLAGLYFSGDGVERNYQEVFKWTRLAAEQGLGDAQGTLGVLYYYGQGVEKNYQEAAKWFRLAAEQGEATPQYYLGLMYYNGEGVEQNYQEAAKWYRLAAEQGNKEAKRALKDKKLFPLLKY